MAARYPKKRCHTTPEYREPLTIVINQPPSPSKGAEIRRAA